MTANDLSFNIQMVIFGIIFSVIGYAQSIWLIFWLAALLVLISGGLILNAWESE